MSVLARNALIVALLGLLLLFDTFYFKSLRDQANGGSVSEAFLRKGTLGKLLKEHGYLGVSEDSASFAVKGMCADDEELRGFDYHNTARMRFKIHATSAAKVHFKYEVPDADKFKNRRYEAVIDVIPRQYHYGINVYVEKGKAIKLAVTHFSEQPILLSDIIIDGRFGREQTLVENGQAKEGLFVEAVSVQQAEYDEHVSGVVVSKQTPTIYYELPNGVSEQLFSGLFPGKKNQGFCRYSARSLVVGSGKRVNELVPSVHLSVKEEDLYGEKGILANKQLKGREWEVPANLIVNNGRQTLNQGVGLRSHGGTPGRKKDIQSYRVYARNRYGKDQLDPGPIFGRSREKEVQTLVFKYTYQAYFDDSRTVNFNPFNHAFALDIANMVGALVPSHALVDLHINDQPKGLHLAMEHVSNRTLSNWLGHDDFLSYTYKSPNTEHEQHIFFYVLAMITTKRDERILDELKKHYDIDNVINSILLTAYIGDDDYCQGTELIDNLEKPESEWRVTSINWDLDHSFIENDNGTLKIKADRPAFSLLAPEKALCPRRWAYSGAYTRSAEFRKLVRSRLEYLLANELSFESLNKRLDYYRDVNEHYYQGAHAYAIQDLENYIRKRPAILMQRLVELERKTEAQYVLSEK